MRIEVMKIKKGKTEKKTQDVDIKKLLFDLIEADIKRREKVGVKVSISSEEMAVGNAIARKLDIINDLAADFIMPLVTQEFDISNEKRLEYMKRTNDKLSVFIDDMERLLFGAFKLDEVNRNDNED